MVLGGLSVLAGLLFVPLGQLLAYPAWALLAYTTHMVSLLAQIQGAVLFIQSIPLWAVGLWYLGLLLVTPARSGGAERPAGPL